MNIEDTIHNVCLPVNSFPLLDRLRELLGEAGTNDLGLLTGPDRVKARKIMWLLLQQLHGQLSKLDLCEEWHFLVKFHPDNEGEWEDRWSSAEPHLAHLARYNGPNYSADIPLSPEGDSLLRRK